MPFFFHFESVPGARIVNFVKFSSFLPAGPQDREELAGKKGSGGEIPARGEWGLEPARHGGRRARGGAFCLGEELLLEALHQGDDLRATGEHGLRKFLIMSGISLGELRERHENGNGVVHRVLDLAKTLVQSEDLAARYR